MSLLVVFSMINKTVVKTFLEVNYKENAWFPGFFSELFTRDEPVLTQVETDFLKHMFFEFTRENSCFDMKKYSKKMLSTWVGKTCWSRGGSLVSFHMGSPSGLRPF